MWKTSYCALRIRAPHLLQKLIVSQYPARVPRKRQQQGKFLGRKFDGRAVHRDFMARHVDAQRSDFDDGLVGAIAGRAKRGTHTREEFRGSERLVDVIVRAGIESGDLACLIDAHRGPAALSWSSSYPARHRGRWT